MSVDRFRVMPNDKAILTMNPEPDELELKIFVLFTSFPNSDCHSPVLRVVYATLGFTCSVNTIN
jgi:hypothetical protein